MAEAAPGFVAGTYLASLHRIINAALVTRVNTTGSSDLLARSGVLGSGSLRITPSSALTLAVSAGVSVLQGANSTQGAYILVNDAPDTVTLSAADPSLPRRDAVIARLYDDLDGVGGNGKQWVLDKVPGNPSASPTLPALPIDSMLLGDVTVPAGATSIVSGNITDGRSYTVAVGGILPCVAADMPTEPDPGQVIWRTDTRTLSVWDSTAAAWQSIYQRRIWTDLALTAPYANYAANGYANLGYSIRNGICSLRGVIKSTASTAAGATIATLPAGARPSTRLALSLPGPGSATAPTSYRVDILTTGAIVDQTAHAALTSLLVDNIHIPLD